MRLCRDVKIVVRWGVAKLVVQIQLRKAIIQTHAKYVEALEALKRLAK
jgi:hypothetical protein